MFSVDRKHVTVAGAARSGLAAAELLARRGAHVTLSDTRSRAPEAEPLLQLGVRLELGGHSTEAFSGADLVVLSPGVSPEQPVIGPGAAPAIAPTVAAAITSSTRCGPSR